MNKICLYFRVILVRKQAFFTYYCEVWQNIVILNFINKNACHKMKLIKNSKISAEIHGRGYWEKTFFDRERH